MMNFQGLIPPDVFSKLQESWLVTQQFQSKIESYVTEARETFMAFGEKFRKALEVSAKVMSGLELVTNEFLYIMLSIGWPPPVDLPIEQMMTIVKAFKMDNSDSGIRKIENHLILFYDRKIIDDILDSWKNNILLKNRLPILEAVIHAHHDKNYWLSVPGILPQIEGIVAYGYKHLGEMNGRMMKNYLRSLLDEQYSKIKINPVLFDFISSVLLVGFRHGVPLRSNLSRHAILHGADINYGCAENSLKAILTFDYLQDAFRLVSLNKSKIYHKVGCPYIYKRNTVNELKLYKFKQYAENDGKKPCRKCNPNELF